MTKKGKKIKGERELEERLRGLTFGRSTGRQIDLGTTISEMIQAAGKARGGGSLGPAGS